MNEINNFSILVMLFVYFLVSVECVRVCVCRCISEAYMIAIHIGLNIDVDMYGIERTQTHQAFKVLYVFFSVLCKLSLCDYIHVIHCFGLELRSTAPHSHKL